MTVTLETLRADLMEKWDALFKLSAGLISFSPTQLYWDKVAQMEFAEQVWKVARDHGLKAAMAYKLTDGAIDPRVQP